MSEFVNKLQKRFYRRTFVFVLSFTILFLMVLPVIVYFVELSGNKHKIIERLDKLTRLELANIIDEKGEFKPNYPLIEDSINDLYNYGDIVDFRIWVGNKILYSFANKSFIGRKFINEELIESIKKNKIISEYVNPGKNENYYLLDKGLLLETYIPITKSGKVVAVAEYYTVAPKLFLLGPQTFAVILFASLIPFIVYVILYREFKNAIKTLDNFDNKLKVSYDKLGISYSNSIKSLSKVLEMKDVETEGHAERVALISLNIANKLKLNSYETGQIVIGAYLHDIGKISVPDSIILKNEALSDFERKIVQKHVLMGYKLVESDEVLSTVKDLILYHHEKWDGTGYIHGLKGEEIPFIARIFSIIDVFDALVSERPYKKAYNFNEAMDVIKSYSGSYFDPALVEVFLTLTENEYNDIISNIDSVNISNIINSAIRVVLNNKVAI